MRFTRGGEPIERYRADARSGLGTRGFSSRLGVLVLAVLLEDVLMRCTLGRHIRVVVPAQDVRSPFQRVMAYSPTALGVAIDLPDRGVDPEADGTDEGRLAEVGPEAGPEVVIQVRPAVERAGVKRKPVLYGCEERNDQSDPNHHQEKKHAKYQPPDSGPSSGFEFVPRRATACGHRRGSG